MERLYDLEERTFRFAQLVRFFIAKLPKTSANYEDGRQVIRSSGSVAANYIEAREGVSERDSLLRIKICRKEAKETILWLRLLAVVTNPTLEKTRTDLITEATELMKIMSSLVLNRS